MTDSIFITIPTKKKYDKSEKWDFVEKHSKNINELIVQHMKDLVKKQNIDAKEIKTSFKSEMVMSDIFFLDKKKNYACKLEIKEGKIVDPAKITYTGLQIVKNDTAEYTRSLLKDMIDNVILNSNIPLNKKIEMLTNVIIKHRQSFDEQLNNYDFNNVAKPTKWNKKDNIIESMKLYNFIAETETFTPNSAGKYIYVIFEDQKVLKPSGIDLSKIDMLTIPLKYDKDFLKEKMIKYNISINKEKQYKMLFNTTCISILNVTKKLLKRKQNI